jgi:hypothetical protein
MGKGAPVRSAAQGCGLGQAKDIVSFRRIDLPNVHGNTHADCKGMHNQADQFIILS